MTVDALACAARAHRVRPVQKPAHPLPTTPPASPTTPAAHKSMRAGTHTHPGPIPGRQAGRPMQVPAPVPVPIPALVAITGLDRHDHGPHHAVDGDEAIDDRSMKNL